jgi:hypothetical protein
VDVKIFYQDGDKQKLLRDQDKDGHFEITQWFQKTPWTMLMELDVDGNGKPEGRYCYKEGVIRIKEIDEDTDGIWDLREYYTEDGKLEKSEEDDEGAGNFTIIWYYDEEEKAVRAEKDADKDGKIDTWFYYDNGSIERVEEDTNGDGKPDIWEEYDEAEALVKRSKDLNYDGTPDMEKLAGSEGSEQVSRGEGEKVGR